MTEQQWLQCFGVTLQWYMSDNSINQRRLARKAGISESALSMYINAERMPSAVAVVKLAKVLNCSLDELMDFGGKVC